MSEKFDGYEEELAKREEVIKNMKEDVTKLSKCSRETLWSGGNARAIFKA